MSVSGPHLQKNIAESKNTAPYKPQFSASSSSSSSDDKRKPASSRFKYSRSRFSRHLSLKGTNYSVVTSARYLNEKYGHKRAHYIEKFIKCIHKKMDAGVEKISDEYVDSLGPWVKVKLFLLLVTLSQRGGPEYWSDRSEQDDKSDVTDVPKEEPPRRSRKRDVLTLTEQVMRHNIKQDFTEDTYDESYVFSSIWANFMEGLINHYLERIIIPHSEMKVCQQLYKPMMKIISLYNEYNDLMEKSERNGFLPPTAQTETETTSKNTTTTSNNNSAQDRLQRAQKLLWQARQDIPKTISKELTLLSEMYSTLSADEQDYELDEFVCCAEEYIELEYLPALIEVLFANCGSVQFWKVMIVLEPFFYYIEDVGDEEADIEEDEMDKEAVNFESDTIRRTEADSPSRFSSDPRVVTLEKICKVAARQNWI